MEKVEGIIYYKTESGEKVPVNWCSDYKGLLKENQDLLDGYKQKTLYLWAKGTEFLVKG